jgi:hypothetical protein
MSRLPLRFANWLRRSRGAAIATAALAAAAFTPNAALAVVTLSGGGLVLAEQGGTFAPNNVAGSSFGAIPFTSSDLGPELGIPFHVAANLNDEIYGNSNSWIGGGTNPFPAPFAGISLDGAFTLQSIAFGRDNGPSFLGDRALGLYTLQYTTVAGPGASTPDASWTTIGTLNYLGAGGVNFSSPALRHRFNFSPVANVTGVRLLVPGTGIGGGTAIDEIELYEAAGVVVPPPPVVTLTPAAGYGIGYNGNDGDHYDPTPPPAGAQAPNNLALASNGAIAISSSDLGPELGIPFHVKGNLNDGTYGNSNSWIGGALPGGVAAPFAGVTLDGLFYVDRVAWGRDNGNGAFDDSVAGSDACGGQCDDRFAGTYTLQYTQVLNADGNTPHTGDPTTGWADIGGVNYSASNDLGPGGEFTGYLRHEFTVQANGGPVLASGIRLLVPSTGLATGVAIDEIEVYGSAVPEPSTYAMVAMAMGSVVMLRRRRK